MVIGIDDWAWRRNQRYGTIICDPKRRRPIRLLTDREPATALDWLEGQPQIEIIARDRPRPGRRLYVRGRESAARRAAGRRPVASDGECKQRLPRCSAQVHA